MKLRSYSTCPKDATEAIFEYIRQTLFQDEISRINCVYYCESLDEAIQYAMDDWISCGDKTKEEVKILMVDVDDRRVAKYDQTFYNEAYEAVENCEFNKALELAKVYFSKTYSAKPIYELLSDGANRIMEEIKY